MIHLFAGAKLAQPVEEVTAAVDGGAQHLLVQFPVGYLLVVLDSLFPAVGHAGLLVPLGIDREIGVGVIGVAAQTAGFLQDYHLFPRHGCRTAATRPLPAPHTTTSACLTTRSWAGGGHCPPC